MKVKTIWKWIWIFSIGSSLSYSVYATDEHAVATPHFCGEPIPLEKATVSRQFLSALQHHFVRSLDRIKPTAIAHFKIIEPILTQNNIPNDFKYLCLIESTFSAKATSHKGASGYWQFMPETAKEMGLRVDREVDERRHLVKSTWAACRYFNHLYSQLGSWTSVAAAYNAGIGRVYDYMRRAQSMDYYDWRTNRETGQYLYRLIAVKEWFDSPVRYHHWINYIKLSQQRKTRNSSPIDQMIIEVEIVEDSSEVFDATEIGIAQEFFEQTAPPSSSTPAEPVIVAPTPSTTPQFVLTTKLKEANFIPQKGHVWVFEVVETTEWEGQKIEAGDRLYATVEYMNSAGTTLNLKLTQLYSPKRHQMYQLPFSLQKEEFSVNKLAENMGLTWIR